MTGRHRKPITRCANDDTAENQHDRTVAVMVRLMQQLSDTIDPQNAESTRERLHQLVEGLTEKERTIFLDAVYGSSNGREPGQGN